MDLTVQQIANQDALGRSLFGGIEGIRSTAIYLPRMCVDPLTVPLTFAIFLFLFSWIIIAVLVFFVTVVMTMIIPPTMMIPRPNLEFLAQVIIKKL